jgi:hypothetical protein
VKKNQRNGLKRTNYFAHEQDFAPCQSCKNTAEMEKFFERSLNDDGLPLY